MFKHHQPFPTTNPRDVVAAFLAALREIDAIHGGGRRVRTCGFEIDLAARTVDIWSLLPTGDAIAEALARAFNQRLDACTAMRSSGALGSSRVADRRNRSSHRSRMGSARARRGRGR